MKKHKRWLPNIIILIYIIIFIVLKIEYAIEFNKKYNSNFELSMTIDENGYLQIEKDNDGKILMERYPVDPIPPTDITQNIVFICSSIICLAISCILNIKYIKTDGGFNKNKTTNYIFIALIIICIIIRFINVNVFIDSY